MDIKDTDQEAALILNREINANPRRRSSAASSPNSFPNQSSRRETRASKRAKRDTELPLMTPISASSTSTNPISMDSSSSPLSSTPTSDLQSPDDAMLSRVVRLRYSPGVSRNIDKILNQRSSDSPDDRSPSKSIKTSSARGSQGITNISIADANNRSQPLPGPELLQMVEEAKDRGEIPKLPDSNVVRRMDDKWMAPQICTSCQQLKKACDRKFPCSACSSAQSACTSDGFMTILRSVQAKKSTKMTAPALAAEIGDPMAVDPPTTQTQASQNSDRSTVQDQPASTNVQPEPKTRQRKKPAPKGSARKTQPDVDGESEATASEIEMQKRQKSRGKKRKADDEDFAPGDISSTAEVQDKADIATGEKTSKAKKKTKGAKSGQPPSKYHENLQQQKPEPYSQPLVWANQRQPLCDALYYYKAHQGAVFTHERAAYGFLCDKEVSVRDKFHDEIMIARCGGDREADATGKMVQVRDQVTCFWAQAFERSRKEKMPVAIIAGQGNSISPSQLPHYYNVLDWFHVTDVWCDKVDGFKTWLVRLEKINLDERSWWSAKGSVESMSNLSEGTNVKIQTCEDCRKPSKTIVTAGWTCLNSQCDSHFKFSEKVNEETLEYADAFLKERTKYLGAPPGPIVPPLPTDEELLARVSGDKVKVIKRGIVCPKCRCCGRRIEWHQWSCENPDCDFTYSLEKKIVPITEVITEGMEERAGENDLIGGGIRTGQMVKGLYDVTEYIIPGENGEDIGFVRLFRANGLINQQPDGPNDLFRQMQEDEFGLRRNPARNPGGVKEELTSHWATNWGAPYKYSVSQLSTAFDEAKPVILKALKRLTWAGEQAVTANFETFHPFNELLSLGYLEESEIHYHDDGEKELGPTIATLSLGCDAVMRFRPKAKSKIGVKRNNAKGTKADVLRIILQHGDIVIMHGTLIQKYYEHAVEPNGKLRFGLTCRYVDPAKMRSNADRQDAAIKGALPPGSEKYDYDGDINAKPIAPRQKVVSPVKKFIHDLTAMIHSGEVEKKQVLEDAMAALKAL